MNEFAGRPSVLEILNRNGIGLAPSLFDEYEFEVERTTREPKEQVPFIPFPRSKSDDDPSTYDFQPLEADTHILWSGWYEVLEKLPPLSSEEMIEQAIILERGVEACEFLKNNEVKGDELARLTNEISEGTSAFERMYEHNLRLVRNMAIRSRTILPGLNIEDAFQAGAIGLFTSIAKWDWRRGYNFSTYATAWIKQSIQRDSHNFHGQVRLPIHKYTGIYFDRKSLEWWKDDGSQLEINPLSDFWSLQNMLSLEVIREHSELHDLAMHNDDVEIIEMELFWEWVRDFLFRILDAKKIQIIGMRFGLDRDNPATLDEIGQSIGVTRERVRQIEKVAVLEVRLYILSTGLLVESISKSIQSSLSTAELLILNVGVDAINQRDLRKRLKDLGVVEADFEEVMFKALRIIYLEINENGL